MKKKNKVVFKLQNLIIALVFIFSMAINMMIPLTVSADGTKNIVITFRVSDQSDVTLAAIGVGNSQLPANEEGGGLKGFRGDFNAFIDIRDAATDQNIGNGNLKVTCTSDKLCTATATVPEDHGVKVVTPGGTPFQFKINGVTYGGENALIDAGAELEIVNIDNNDEGFNGRAYLIWSCENGGVCYHLFDNLPTDRVTPSFFRTSEVLDDVTNEEFKVDADEKAFALEDSFLAWQEAYKTFKNVSTIDWSSVDINDVIAPIDMRKYEQQAIDNGACTTEGVAEDDFHNCVDQYAATTGDFVKRALLQPVGEPVSNNAYVSYGDRNFKVTIYNDDYRGISLGSLEDLEYYPSTWVDPFLRVDSYDISATTKTNPVDIDTVLLEPTINIKALNYNGFNIESMEALDVPSGAVSVTKEGGEFKLRFSSNFYDKVIFKVKSTNNEVYYLRINRRAIDVDIRHHENKVVIESNFYFNRNKSYSDFVIKAKIVYKDGTYKIVNMKNAKKIDDGLANFVYDYEKDLETYGNEHDPKGKGLKQATYNYEITEAEKEKISKVYVNVEKVGSTQTSYAGAFTGSGKGVELDMERD